MLSNSNPASLAKVRPGGFRSTLLAQKPPRSWIFSYENLPTDRVTLGSSLGQGLLKRHLMIKSKNT